MYEEFSYNDKDHIIDILIKHYNNLLCDSNYSLYNFIEILRDNLINNKLSINKNILNNKSAEIIDLTSYTNIKHELSYTNKTLLYEYLNSKLNEKDKLHDEEFINKYKTLFINLFNDIDNYDIKVNYSLKKIFSSLFDLEINDNNNLNYIINYLSEFNSDKIYIIFYNSDIININRNNNNIYLFDINKDKLNNEIILKTNKLICNTCLTNINNYLLKKLLINEIELNNLIKIYFTYYISNKFIYTYNKNFYNICIELNKLYKFDKQIIYLVDKTEPIE